MALLNKAGIKTDVHESGGFHSWNNRRDYLNLFASLLFTPREAKYTRCTAPVRLPGIFPSSLTG